MENSFIAGFQEPILITGANGFIGSKVVETLLAYGFKNLRAFVRNAIGAEKINKLKKIYDTDSIEIFEGNLLSVEDCRRAANEVAVVFHLAAGMEKTFAGCFMNSVLTTRNLLECIRVTPNFKRFLNVSSFAVYSNMAIPRGGVIDESSMIETSFVDRDEAYCYSKVKQEEIVIEYGRRYQIPYVIMRPGVVFGPGSRQPLHSRVGIDTFGTFFHLGGNNKIPFTFIDNCAEAIVLGGLTLKIENEIFNIVDDDLPTSNNYLKAYKRIVKSFHTLNIPYEIFYLFSWCWERYSELSKEQIPRVFNRRKCSALWKGNIYNNEKLKSRTGWRPKIGMEEAMTRHFEYFRGGN